MSNGTRRFPGIAPLLVVALLLVPAGGIAQTASGQASRSTDQSASATKPDRWLHVRVENPDSKDETVRVNVPLELAEKVLPTIKSESPSER
jgi:hypothetical protein